MDIPFAYYTCNTGRILFRGFNLDNIFPKISKQLSAKRPRDNFGNINNLDVCQRHINLLLASLSGIAYFCSKLGVAGPAFHDLPGEGVSEDFFKELGSLDN